MGKRHSLAGARGKSERAQPARRAARFELVALGVQLPAITTAVQIRVETPADKPLARQQAAASQQQLLVGGRAAARG
jgi:hypothetical protein